MYFSIKFMFKYFKNVKNTRFHFCKTCVILIYQRIQLYDDKKCGSRLVHEYNFNSQHTRACAHIVTSALNGVSHLSTGRIFTRCIFKSPQQRYPFKCTRYHVRCCYAHNNIDICIICQVIFPETNEHLRDRVRTFIQDTKLPRTEAEVLHTGNNSSSLRTPITGSRQSVTQQEHTDNI